MLLKAAPAFSLLNPHKEAFWNPLSSSVSSSVLHLNSRLRAKNGAGVIICASKGASNSPLTGVVFEPFEEVKKELDLVPSIPQVSLARQKYHEHCEAAVNEQINVEYNVSYVYHAMFAYFDRDNVALRGLAKFFKESSIEEREHAEKFMEYQNKRGGKVKLASILMPLTEFDHAEKGDALYAMELTLSLEKLTNEKLLNLHKVANQHHDVQLADFVESKFLSGAGRSHKKDLRICCSTEKSGQGTRSLALRSNAP
ncbi:hypothetical protein Patl1_06674 [Pistacia atlantica]|uniref:Uncharacterized protein n=1 Tax=Pistacia atlantica TaxID=434234 RepID=A0ACC1BPB1_9ROSI|nr:hypothetical protein Patl1_06674 [Pistacia atlantica]